MRSASCIRAQGEMNAFTAPQTYFYSSTMAASSCIAPKVTETLQQFQSNDGFGEYRHAAWGEPDRPLRADHPGYDDHGYSPHIYGGGW